MQIGVIGATGTIGSRVVSEALSRGHHITAFSRGWSFRLQGRAAGRGGAMMDGPGPL